MKIYFSHGKESGPWGNKIRRLAAIARERACEVESVDYTDLEDPDLRVERLLDVLKDEDDSFILVGSSMGGYVALLASEQVHARAVFLLAPAIYILGYKQQNHFANHENTEIIHGWFDEVIPPEHSIQFAKEAGCTLHLISGDHRLSSSIETVENLFRLFLEKALSA